MKVSKIAFIEAGQTNKVTFDRHVKMLRKIMKYKFKNQPNKISEIGFKS